MFLAQATSSQSGWNYSRCFAGMIEGCELAARVLGAMRMGLAGELCKVELSQE